MIKMQTLLVKSRNITSLLSAFNSCLKFLGGKKRDCLITGWQYRFYDKFLPCCKDFMTEKVQCFIKRSIFFLDNNC